MEWVGKKGDRDELEKGAKKTPFSKRVDRYKKPKRKENMTNDSRHMEEA
jgi:hypothetical protein